MSTGEDNAISIAKLSGFSYHDLIKHCVNACEETPKMMSSRVEQLDVVYAMCNVDNGPALDLMQAVSFHRILTKTANLVRDIRDDPEGYPGG